jgi:SAM-dependent methyltransferase
VAALRSGDAGPGAATGTAVDWPGRDRREPRILDRLYLPLAGLASVLRQRVETELAGRTGLRVVDLGCGAKPYYPWLQPHAGEYIGVDAYPGPYVDHVSPAEDLGFLDSSSVDVVICTQVLEHALAPAAVLAEVHRVLKPRGLCLLSTHGVFVYHQQPNDYWRWTHEGLRRLFEEAGFATIEVVGTEGIASAISGLAGFYVYALAERFALLRFLKVTVHPALNVLAPRLDRYLGWVFGDHPLSINYLVVARRA